MLFISVILLLYFLLGVVVPSMNSCHPQRNELLELYDQIKSQNCEVDDESKVTSALIEGIQIDME